MGIIYNCWLSLHSGRVQTQHHHFQEFRLCQFHFNPQMIFFKILLIQSGCCTLQANCLMKVCNGRRFSMTSVIAWRSFMLFPHILFFGFLDCRFLFWFFPHEIDSSYITMRLWLSLYKST